MGRRGGGQSGRFGLAGGLFGRRISIPPRRGKGGGVWWRPALVPPPLRHRLPLPLRQPRPLRGRHRPRGRSAETTRQCKGGGCPLDCCVWLSFGMYGMLRTPFREKFSKLRSLRCRPFAPPSSRPPLSSSPSLLQSTGGYVFCRCALYFTRPGVLVGSEPQDHSFCSVFPPPGLRYDTDVILSFTLFLVFQP